MKHFSFHKWRKNKIKRVLEPFVSLVYPYIIRTWNPNDPCFDWKRPCFEGFNHQNRGQTGSRYTYILSVPFISTSGPNRTRQYPITTRPPFHLASNLEISWKITQRRQCSQKEILDRNTAQKSPEFDVNLSHFSSLAWQISTHPLTFPS